MTICMIAAVGKNLELGKDNNLIWHFKDDMAFFKETTTGSSIIMGRKTFESLPKVLPRRKNIIITKKEDYKAEGATVVHSISEALNEVESDTAFIIGGGDIYRQFLPKAEKLYLTEIEAECPDADAYFPENFNNKRCCAVIIKHAIQKTVSQSEKFRIFALACQSDLNNSRQQKLNEQHQNAPFHLPCIYKRSHEQINDNHYRKQSVIPIPRRQIENQNNKKSTRKSNPIKSRRN